MPNTPNYSLPYPLATDPANVPLDMQELAEAVDTSLDTVDDRVDVLEPKVSTLESDVVSLDSRLDTIEPKVPANRIAPGTEGQILKTISGAAAWGAEAGGGGGGVLGYNQLVNTVAVPIGTEATAVTLVTGPAVAVDGATRICVEFFAPMVYSYPYAGSAVILCLFEGATSLGLLGQFLGGANGGSWAADVKRVFTPTNGSHTYTIKAYALAASGCQVTAGNGGAGAWVPAFILISKA